MPQVIRFPILRKRLTDRFILEIMVPLELRSDQGTWFPYGFLFDTGTEVSTIPFSIAHMADITVPTNRPARIQGATGVAPGFLAPFRFCVLGLEHLMFEGLACFTALNLKRPLLALTDVLSHFEMRSVSATALHPLGSLELRLHKNHQGKARGSS